MSQGGEAWTHGKLTEQRRGTSGDQWERSLGRPMAKSLKCVLRIATG